MKKILYYICLSMMVMAIGSCGNKSKNKSEADSDEDVKAKKGDVRISLEVTDLKLLNEQDQKAVIDNTEQVLRNRLEKEGIDCEITHSEEGPFIHIEMPKQKNMERVFRLLANNGNIEFWETYRGDELYYILQDIMSKYTEDLAIRDSLARMMGAADSLSLEEYPTLPEEPRLMLTNLSYAVVGYASEKDTAAINRMLQHPGVKSYLHSLSDGEARLLWGAKPIVQHYTNMEDPVFELFALKVTAPSGRAPIEGDVIVSAKAERDQDKRPIVSMQMNSYGSRVWADLTKKNLKRRIAIVLDDVVYTAPTIHSEITGGLSQISGNFTVEETKDLANILSSGKLPMPVRIVSYQIEGE